MITSKKLMSKKILVLAKETNLMDISIKYGEETFRFNLYDELKVDEENLTAGLKTQPTKYAFLTTLRAKLTRVCSNLEREAKRAYAEAYQELKSGNNPTTSRAYTNEDARTAAETSPRYLKVLSKLSKAQEDRDVIDGAVRAIEQRKDVLQTISANRRKERE